VTVTDFASLRAAVIDDAILSTDYFAETGTYLPKEGEARSVIVNARFKLDTNYTDEGDEETVETLQVLVKRNSTDGIDRPMIGDRFLRSEARDPSQRPFMFSGEIAAEIGTTHYKLIFWRHTETGRGAGQS